MSAARGCFRRVLGVAAARRANEEAGTTWERLDGISRASFGAVLFWSAKKSRDGAPPSGADKDETLAIVILDALSMVLLLGVAVYHHIYKERVKEDVDDNTITMDDYAVEVRGLPPDATEESVRAHFERHCGPVHEITSGRDVLEVMELRKKALALEANHELLEWMLRRAQKLLGEASDDDRDGPARWRRLWRKAYDKTKRELVAAGVGVADAPPEASGCVKVVLYPESASRLGAANGTGGGLAGRSCVALATAAAAACGRGARAVAWLLACGGLPALPLDIVRFRWLKLA